MKVKTLARNIGAMAKKNAPKILTGASVAGSLVTIVLTVRATAKAKEAVNSIMLEKTAEVYANEDFTSMPLAKARGLIKPTNKEIVKATWKYYIPVAISFAATTACTVCSSVESNKREVAAMALYSTAHQALEEYKNVTEKVVGEDKAKEIEKESAVNAVRNQSLENIPVVELTTGSFLYRDNFTGLYFRSTESKIQSDFYEFNKKFRNDCQLVKNNHGKDGLCSIPLDELYYALGFSPVDIPPIVNDYKMVCHPLYDDIHPVFDYDVAPTGEPCGVLIFSERPWQKDGAHDEW